MQDLTQLTLAELTDVEVSSVGRREEGSAHARAAVHAVTPEDLRQQGVTSLAEALRLAPGATVARADSSGWAVGIRGFTSRLARAQLVLIDGRSVYDPLFAGTYWEVQDTVLEDLERIEIVRGPGGTLWGANAVNGIVSVVTKPPSQTQGGLISLGGGPEEQFGTFRYGGRFGAAGAYRAYAKAFARDATWHPDGSEYDGWHMAQGGFRTAFDLGVDHRLTVQGDLYGGQAGQRTTLTTYTPPYLSTVDGDVALSGANLLTRWEREGFRLQGYFDRSDRDEAKFGEVRDTFDLDFQHRVAPIGRHAIVWGLGYRRSAGDSRGIDTVMVVPAYRADELFTGFVQDDASFAGGRVRVAVGAKVEHNGYTGFEVQPSIRALWVPTADHSFWGAVTRAVRTPSRIEHDIDVTVATSATAPVFLRWFGDPGFESETVHAFEFGYRANFGKRVSFDAAAFLNAYDNLLGLAPGSATPEAGRLILSVVTANGLEGHSAGFETSVTARPFARWLLRANYAYLSLTLAPKAGSGSLTTGAAEEGSTPRHQVLVRSVVSLSPRWEVSGAFRWIDELAGQDVEAYAELDARVSWRPTSAIEIALLGRNLLHARHLEFVGDAPTPSEIERTLVATLRLGW
jgi:iron complex outermembrane receptor protein